MRTSKTLYRAPKQGKIAGVCAGIADYFNIEVWLVRILTITAFLLVAGPFIFVCYIAAWLILDKKPENEYDNDYAASHHASNAQNTSTQAFTSTDKPEKVHVKAKVWQAGVPPKQAFLNIQQRFIRSENRLRKLESYVTSKEYQLDRELNRL